MAFRKPLAGTISMGAVTVALAALATPAMAQDADGNPNEAEAAEEDEGDVIIVSGFRASLESAIAEKKRADQIVE